MDLWATLLAPCIIAVLSCLCGPISSCLGGMADNMWNLGQNLRLLKTAMENLESERDIVQRRVKDEEIESGQQVTTLVASWIKEVETIVEDTKKVLDTASGDNNYSQDASPVRQQLSTSGCCWSSTCFLGEEVSKKLNEVRRLSGQDFKEVTDQDLPLVKVRPCEETFGLTTTLEKTWRSLMDDKNRILGIHGMGGIGKTTLLTIINNKFVEVEKDYDVVIWVKVSKDADIGKIQDDIRKRLRISDNNWCTKTQCEKADIIGRALTAKTRFVLLLDDLWEEVSLAAIGIPVVGQKYKVVFTTRYKHFYGSMNAIDHIEVKCLEEKDAWDIFKEKAKCERFTEGDEILGIAKQIAAKCCGLPLALEVIGKILASKTTIDDWSRALSKLESTPMIALRGIENCLFRVLKLSYDNLKDEDVKLCFQYCALFPKAYNIKRDELVEYWIGEDIIGKKYERQKAKGRGDDIIDILVEACLLLKDGESEQKLYMHDMIREIALLIVSKFEKGEEYVVQAGAGLSQLPYVTDWTTITKMSLMNNEIKSIPDDPEYPTQARLKTLFLQNNSLVEIVGKFFVFMSTLVVLDLSWNKGLTELPREISMLIALRYLSLSGTKITDLPVGLGELNKLIHLDLEFTSNLQSITSILQLQRLQVLRFYDSGVSLDVSILEQLQRLKRLEHLTITVRKFDVLKAFLESELAGKTQGIYLEGLEVSGISFAESFGALGSLCTLQMVNCDIIESDTEWEENTRHQSPVPTPSNQITPSNKWFTNLSVVVLTSCQGLRDLTWLIYATKLESLTVTLSPMMEELISEDKAKGVKVDMLFQKLQVLHLEYLDELKCIQRGPLTFPSMKKSDIKYCPKLPSISTSI